MTHIERTMVSGRTEGPRISQQLPQHEVGLIADRFLEKIKSKFKGYVRSQEWGTELTRVTRKGGKSIRIDHGFDERKRISTTTIEATWKELDKERKATLEVIRERPILSIAGYPLWRIDDLSDFTFTADGEDPFQKDREGERRGNLFLDSL